MRSVAERLVGGGTAAAQELPIAHFVGEAIAGNGHGSCSWLGDRTALLASRAEKRAKIINAAHPLTPQLRDLQSLVEIGVDRAPLWCSPLR